MAFIVEGGLGPLICVFGFPGPQMRGRLKKKQQNNPFAVQFALAATGVPESYAKR
jgi:hypothetical protein